MAYTPIRNIVFSSTTTRREMFDVIIFNSINRFPAEAAVGGFSLNLHLAHLLEIRFAYIHQNNPTIPVLNAATIMATTRPHNNQYTFLLVVASVISHLQNLYLQLVCCSAIEYPFGYACNLSFNIGNARLALYNR